jgi:hypothetical protein
MAMKTVRRRPSASFTTGSCARTTVNALAKKEQPDQARADPDLVTRVRRHDPGKDVKGAKTRFTLCENQDLQEEREFRTPRDLPSPRLT